MTPEELSREVQVAGQALAEAVGQFEAAAAGRAAHLEEEIASLQARNVQLETAILYLVKQVPGVRVIPDYQPTPEAEAVRQAQERVESSDLAEELWNLACSMTRVPGPQAPNRGGELEV